MTTDQWILLTCELPSTKEGKAKRRQFLKMSKEVGAMPHAPSVYVLPRSDTSVSWAKELAGIGNGWVWESKLLDPGKNKFLLSAYDTYLESLCKEVDVRVDKITHYASDGNLSMARRMGQKTLQMMIRLAKINDFYGAEWLDKRLDGVFAKIEVIKFKETPTPEGTILSLRRNTHLVRSSN